MSIVVKNNVVLLDQRDKLISTIKRLETKLEELTFERDQLIENLKYSEGLVGDLTFKLKHGADEDMF